MPSLRFLVLLLVLAALAGCDEGIEPTSGAEFPFALFGQFDADADTQAVRVVAIAETIETLDPDSIDARVTSTHEQSGESRVWSDSLVRYADGTRGHVFFAPFEVDYDGTYSLRAERSDGEAATVTVTVPPLTMLDSLRREGAVGPVRYVVGVEDAPRLTGVRATYTFVGDLPSVQVVRHTDLAERTDTGWEVAIPFEEDVRDILSRSQAGDVGLLAFEGSVYVSNEEWNVDAAGGAFDPEGLVQPGALSDGENGFGFYGAGYRLRRQIQPFTQDLLRAGLCILNEEQTGCAGGTDP
jgi:hypothetical protein